MIENQYINWILFSFLKMSKPKRFVPTGYTNEPEPVPITNPTMKLVQYDILIIKPTKPKFQLQQRQEEQVLVNEDLYNHYLS